MATSNPISGQPVVHDGGIVHGVNTTVGDQDNKVVNTGGDGQNIQGVTSTSPLGTADNANPVGVHQAVIDRVGSLPSGYNVDLSIDVGEGIQNLSVSWPDDNDLSGEGQFQFYKPLAIEQKDYNNLTS